MKENKSHTNTVRKNNWKVFIKGVLISVVGFFILFGLSWWWGISSTHGMAIFFVPIVPILIGLGLISTVVLNIILLILFIFLNLINAEIIGAKKWVFYISELVLPSMVAYVALSFVPSSFFV